jgi:hypothetical protein
MELLTPLAAAVVGVLVAIWRARAARRRRASVGAGVAARCRARLAVDGGPLERGRLTMSPTVLVWHGRGSTTVDLAGAHVLSAVVEPRQRQARADDAVLHLALPSGGRAWLLLHHDDAGLVARMVQDGVPRQEPAALATPPSRHRGRVWPSLCLGLAAVWAAGWLWLVLTGYTVQATVVSNGEEGCGVTWVAHDGHRHGAEVDCGNPRIGSSRSVWALGPPFDGEAVDPAWTVGSALLLGALVAVPGTVGLVGDRRRRSPAVTIPTPSLHPTDLPELTLEDVVARAGESPVRYLDRLAPYAARQLPPDGWSPEGRRGDGGRSVVRIVLRALRGPAVVLAVVATLAGGWSYRWYVVSTSPTVAVTGTSTGEEVTSGAGPIPAEYRVRYSDTDGVAHAADVATTRALAAGTPVVVRYASDRPGWARLEGPVDGLGRGAVMGLAGVLLALGWAAHRLTGVSAGVRAIRRAERATSRPALGVLTADPFGDPVLLVCDPAVVPVELYAVALRTPLPPGAAAACCSATAVSLRVRGQLREGGAVVVDLPGSPPTTVWPGAPAWRPEPEDRWVVLDSVRLVDLPVEENADREG